MPGGAAANSGSQGNLEKLDSQEFPAFGQQPSKPSGAVGQKMVYQAKKTNSGVA